MADRSPHLTDGVIRLRRFGEQDLEDIVRCCNDESIRRFIPPIPVPYTEEDARSFVGGQAEPGGERSFCIADAGTDRLLGSIGYRTLGDGVGQTGYWVDPTERGRGIATRALTLLSAWAIEQHGLGRLQLFTDVDNLASMRVAERAGFRREGVLRSWYEIRGERRDAVMFSLLPRDLPTASS